MPRARKPHRPLQRSLKRSHKAFETQQSRFRTALEKLDFDKKLTEKERQVIQAARDKRYAYDDLEGAFYSYGEYAGILGLILFFRTSGTIHRTWAVMVEEDRALLVMEVARMLSREVVERTQSFNDARTCMLRGSLRYLGRHAERKQKIRTLGTKDISSATQSSNYLRDTSDTTSQQCQQPQKRPQIGRVGAAPPRNRLDSQLTPTPIYTPPEQELPHQHLEPPNTSSEQDQISRTIPQGPQSFQFHRHTRTPRSNSSSPSEGYPPLDQPHPSDPQPRTSNTLILSTPNCLKWGYNCPAESSQTTRTLPHPPGQRHASQIQRVFRSNMALESPFGNNHDIDREFLCRLDRRLHYNERTSISTSSDQDGASTSHQRSYQSILTPISNASSPDIDRTTTIPKQVSHNLGLHWQMPTSGFSSLRYDSHVPVPPVTSINLTNSSVGSLLLLLQSLGSQIRQDVLFRGLLPQKRWNSRGDAHRISLHDAGLGRFAYLFLSQAELEQTIKSCIQLGSIVQAVLVDGSPVYSISDQSRSSKHEDLHLLGLMFTTHIYPRDQTLDSSFQKFRKLLLPHLEQTWQYVQRKPPSLPAHVRDSFVEASLAACTFGRDDVISVLSKIQDPTLPDYLRMMIAHRKSISLRLKGDHDQSDVIIQDILGSIDTNSTDMRWHCSYGYLLFSLAENSILRDEFEQAKSYLDTWQVENDEEPSGLELQAVRLKNTVFGRVYRYDGKFPDSRDCLEKCLETIPHNESRYHVMYHLADVYCELGIPSKVEELVLGELKELRARGKQRLKAFRRLALPLAEAYVKQGTFEAAETALRELLDIFDGIASHDVADQLGHVRSMIGLARVNGYQARWSETGQYLERALVLTRKYRAFSGGNFYIGVIYLFLSIVNSELHKYPEAQSTFASANELLREQVPRHFMPGMGSYFLEYLWNRARSLGLAFM